MTAAFLVLPELHSLGVMYRTEKLRYKCANEKVALPMPRLTMYGQIVNVCATGGPESKKSCTGFQI